MTKYFRKKPRIEPILRLFHLKFSIFQICQFFIRNDFFVLDEKRGGKLRALCLKNPRALPCVNALGGNQNSNLMW